MEVLVIKSFNIDIYYKYIQLTSTNLVIDATWVKVGNFNGTYNINTTNFLNFTVPITMLSDASQNKNNIVICIRNLLTIYDGPGISYQPENANANVGSVYNSNTDIDFISGFEKTNNGTAFEKYILCGKIQYYTTQ